MIQFTPGQFDKFIGLDESQFVAHIAAQLRADDPDLVKYLPEDSLHAMIRSGLVRARGHGLSSLPKLAGFVGVMFEIAPNFDEHPVISKHLAAQVGTAEDRFDRLFTDLPELVWTEAEDAYDDEAWYPELKDTEAEFRKDPQGK